MDDEKLKLLGYVISSAYRTEVMKTLIEKPKIPSKIAADIGIKQNHISNVLNQLKEKELIRLINPEVRKGRIIWIDWCWAWNCKRIEIGVTELYRYVVKTSNYRTKIVKSIYESNKRVSMQPYSLK